MSVSYSPTPAVSFPARRTPIRPAQDTPLATVRDIASAPSIRRRIEAWLQALSLPSRFP